MSKFSIKIIYYPKQLCLLYWQRLQILFYHLLLYTEVEVYIGLFSYKLTDHICFYMTILIWITTSCTIIHILGFRLESYYFYEQPSVQFNYDYLLIAETDDPSVSVICGQAAALNIFFMENEEFCSKTQVFV